MKDMFIEVLDAVFWVIVVALLSILIPIFIIVAKIFSILDGLIHRGGSK